MRKNLLITTALGLAAAVPSFAMAGSAPAGGACTSGFFIGANANVANYALRVKGNSTAKTDAEAEKAKIATDDKGIQAAVEKALVDAALSQLNALTEANVTLLPSFLGNVTLTNNTGGAIGGVAPGAAVPAAAFNIGDIELNTEGLTNERIVALQFLAASSGAPGSATEVFTTAVFGAPLTDAQIIALAKTSPEYANFKTTYQGFLTIIADSKLIGAHGKKVISDTRTLNAGFRLAEFLDDVVGLQDSKGTVYLLVAPKSAARDATTNVLPSTGTVAAIGDTNIDANRIADVLKNTAKSTKIQVLTIGTSGIAAKDITAQIVKTFGNGAAYKTAIADQIKDKIAEQKVTNTDKIKALDTQIASLADTTRYSTTMGGLGLTAGYRHVLGQCAISARVGVDYLWGSFRSTETDGNKDADKKAKLGFGVSPAMGVHFLASPSAELGIVGGVRFGQLQARKVAAVDPAATPAKDTTKGDYTSKWIWMPFVQGEATLWFSQNVSGSVYAGYTFPVEKTFDKADTAIEKDSKVKVDGVFGGFRVAYHF